MSSLDQYMLPCLNKKFFGFECMGCGSQRSLSLIFQGEFLQAFYMYPAIYSLLLLFGVIAFNAYKNFKHANKIIAFLAIFNGIMIITNFIFKTFLS